MNVQITTKHIATIALIIATLAFTLACMMMAFAPKPINKTLVMLPNGQIIEKVEPEATTTTGIEG